MDSVLLANCERFYHDSLISFRSACDLWRGKDMEEAAYGVLENAAQILRVKNDGVPQIPSEEQLPDELRQMALWERVSLMKNAYVFVENFSLPEHVSRLLQTDVLQPEDIEEVEHLLVQIDDLDAVVDLSDRLLERVSRHDSSVSTKLTKMRCIVAKMVKQLSVREDIVAVCSRLVLKQRKPRYLDDGRPADWFTCMRELDKEPHDLQELLS